MKDSLKIHNGYIKKIKPKQNQAGKGGKGQENTGQEYGFF